MPPLRRSKRRLYAGTDAHGGQTYGKNTIIPSPKGMVGMVKLPTIEKAVAVTLPSSRMIFLNERNVDELVEKINNITWVSGSDVTFVWDEGAQWPTKSKEEALEFVARLKEFFANWHVEPSKYDGTKRDVVTIRVGR